MLTAKLRRILAAAMLLAVPLDAYADPSDEIAVLNRKLGNYAREQRLLHTRLSLDNLGRIDPATQRIWDSRLHNGNKPMLIHLWSVSCGPCVREFPVLRRMMEHLQREAPVHVVFIAEDLPDALVTFFKAQNKELLPKVDYWMSGPGSGIRVDLQEQSQPLTLLLDGDLVVRQAMIGPLAERRAELYSAVSRLFRNLPPHAHS